jgi:hypothetical protein
MGQGRVQLALCCPCGRPEILALGLCATCYTLKRQDEEYFGGLREAVLARDGYRCRGCGAPGREKHSIIVHHRVPGVSKLELMISLCPGCHAKVERTKMVLAEMNPLLLAAGTLARAAPERPGTNHAGLRCARGCGGSHPALQRKEGGRDIVEMLPLGCS